MATKSNIQTTVKRGTVETLTAAQARKIQAVISSIQSVESRAMRGTVAGIRKTADALAALPAGLSGNAFAALVVAASVTPAGVATVSRNTVIRYANVARAALADGWPAMTADEQDAVIADLYTIHGMAASVGGQAAGVTAAADTGRKSKTAADAADAVHAYRTGCQATEGRDALEPRKPARPVGGNAHKSGAGKTPGKTDTGKTPAAAPTPTTLAGLLAALEARLSAKGATVTEADVDAVDRIAARVGELVMAGNLATSAQPRATTYEEIMADSLAGTDGRP